jgi:hypothetical protein
MLAFMYKPSTIPQFLYAFWPNWFALMSGPASVPFAFWGLYAGSDAAKIIFFKLSGLCIVLSCFFVWKKERDTLLKKVSETEAILNSISLERMFAYKNFTMRVNPDPNNPASNNMERFDIIFENLGDFLIKFNIVRLYIETIQNCWEIPLADETGGYIHPRQIMQFGFDMANSNIGVLPIIIKIGFVADYDNVPPLQNRTTKRVIQYTFRSVYPMICDNIIIDQSET